MEFDEIVVKESPGLCRCCLSEGCYKDLGSEYTWMNDNEVYADMLLECFDISITQHNDGPNGPNRLICEVCITRLRDACNFKKQVLESEKKFIDMVARGDFKPKMLIYEAQMKAEDNVEEVNVEDVEYLEDEIDFGDDEPLKHEDLNKPTVSKITVESLSVKGKRGRPRKNEIKTEKRIKLAKTEDKPKTSKAVVKDEYPSSSYEGCTSELRRKNLRVIFNNTTVIPFKWRGRYLCFYCSKSYTEYGEFKKHTKSHGDCNTKDYALRMIKGNHIEIKIDVSEIICDICNDHFDKFDDIVDHLICKHNLEYDKNIDIPYQEYRLVDFRCLHCEEQFSYFGYLVNHVNNVHPQNSFICDECGVSFNKKRDLAVHIRNNHRQGVYPCVQCLLNFETFHSLRKHQNNVHYRQCNSCGLRFVSLSLLQKHMTVEHPDNGSYKCNYCSKELHSSQGLNQHKSKCKVKLITHIEPTNLVSSIDTIKARKNLNLQQMRQNIQCILNMSTATPFKFFSKFACFYCSLKYVEFEELRAHTSLEHPVCDLKSKYMSKCKGERVSVKIDISVLACKLCCLPMLDLNVLADHLVSEHRANYDKSITGCLEPYRIVKDSIPCPLCATVFRYFSTLQRHMNAAHSNNNKICDFCGKSFRNVTNLNVHISYTHTGSCDCHICGAKYKNQWCLARHKAKHHDVKDYKCTKCAEMFHSLYQRQKHLIKVHDEGHKCTYCGRMFTRNSFMKDHIRRTHLKEKNVPCSVCNEKFFDNYLLKLHMVKHEGERKFTCEVCGKAFLRTSNLNAHKQMHKKYGHV